MTKNTQNANKLKTIRILSWVLVALAALGLGADFVLNQPTASPPQKDTGIIASAAEIGGAFSLTNQHGHNVTEADFAGKPRIMFFGFTHCPAICPGALADMGNWLEKLGADADNIHAVFISVDPARDTVAKLASYLKDFDPRIVGLTGTQAQIDAMTKAYKVYAKAMPPMPDGNYMVDHSATLYLFDRAGNLTSTIDTSENPDIAWGKVKMLTKGTEHENNDH